MTKQKKLEQDQFQANALREQYKVVFQNIALLEQNVRDLTLEIQNEECEKTLGDPITIEGFMSLNYCNLHQPLYDRVQKWEEQFHSVYFGGYNTETNQAVIKIKLNRIKPLEYQLDILKFIPFIKPNEEGIKCIIYINRCFKLVKH